MAFKLRPHKESVRSEIEYSKLEVSKIISGSKNSKISVLYNEITEYRGGRRRRLKTEK